MLTEGGHAVRAQQRRADETTYPVTPEQRAARSQRRRAVKCLCQSYDGIGCAEMNTDLMLRSRVWLAEMLTDCSRERRHAWLSDNLVNFIATKGVSREEKVDYRQQRECPGLRDDFGTSSDLLGNVPDCCIEQVQAVCSPVGSFNEQCTGSVPVHDARSADSGKRRAD